MMKTIFDFMADKKEFVWDDSWQLINNNGDIYLIITNKSIYPIHNNYDLIDYLEKDLKKEIRICTYCGSPMDCGYTDDDGDFYNCEECFPKDMNERYGKWNWRACQDGNTNELGGYYEYLNNGEWEPEPSYYTEWY